MEFVCLERKVGCINVEKKFRRNLNETLAPTPWGVFYYLISVDIYQTLRLGRIWRKVYF